MKKLILTCLILFSAFAGSAQTRKYALAIHGGAGNITRDGMKPGMEEKYRGALTQVLHTGDSILAHGGTSLDAVEACVRMMEDCPLFNAGKGAVFNAEGKNELDASIMDGKTGKAGAVAGVTIIKHPISAARAVMERSPHVMMAGKGAETFAIEQQLDTVSPAYFFTQERWNDYQKAKYRQDSLDKIDKKHGTVGCVALDQYGNLAAATSTGGMTMKKYGRIGDSPVIGAGTYANNSTCAVSATGHGEYFIRNVVAYDISALMMYKKYSLKKAADFVVMDKLKKQGGTGGIIAVDKNGNIAMPFNTSGMFRGYVKTGGEIKVSIFGE